MSEVKHIPVLSNWSIGVREMQGDPYTPPELLLRAQVLQGNVTGHLGFQDGDHVTTSAIRGKDAEGKVVTKSGTKYVLNNIDPEYEKLFPNARERLFSTLPEVQA